MLLAEKVAKRNAPLILKSKDDVREDLHQKVIRLEYADNKTHRIVKRNVVDVEQCKIFIRFRCCNYGF